MKKFLLIATVLLVAIVMSAQDVSHIGLTETDMPTIRVSGTIVDKVSHSRMNGVSITVPKTNISTVTNADGFFILKLKECPDRIIISSLGYKTQYINLSNGRHEDLKIRMSPTAITLPELNVWQNDPEALVMTAIDHVSDNFVQKTEQHNVFYRETLQKGSRYIDISEAILTMCKKSYDRGIYGDRVKVEHGRHIMSQRTKDTLSIKVQGGPRTPINYDVVKNQDILFSDIKDGCYAFAMGVPQELDGRTQIVITFRPRITKEWPLYSGTLYLDRQTLAFTRVEMSLDVSDHQKATRMLLVKKPNGLKFKPMELSMVINYRDGRINYMRTFFRFKCDWRKRLFSRSYTSCSEMVVTDFVSDYAGPNIGFRECFNNSDYFVNAIDDMSEKEFWKDYNIIEPTESLEKAIEKLKIR